MEMHVPVDSRPRSMPDVASNVETVRFRDRSKCLYYLPDQHHDFERFFVGETSHVGYVTIRYDHHMTAVVRIKIHHDVAGFPVRYDESPVVVLLPVCRAQDAAGLLLTRSEECINILRPPGRKQSVHVRQ